MDKNLTPEQRLERSYALLTQNRAEEAFDLLIEQAEEPRVGRMLHLIASDSGALFRLRNEQVERLKGRAEAGIDAARFLYGRWCYICRGDREGLDEATRYFEQCNHADGRMMESKMWLKGENYDRMDRERAWRLREQALAEGSEWATMEHISTLIYGDKYNLIAPEEALTEIQSAIAQQLPYPYPRLFHLKALANEVLGRTDEADKALQEAIAHGFSDSWCELILLRCTNEEGISDAARYREMMLQAQAHEIAYGFLLDTTPTEEEWNVMGGVQQMLRHEYIKRNLHRALHGGEGMAAYLLGRYCYYGECGFAQSITEAEHWFKRGSEFGLPICYRMLAQMIYDEHYGPYDSKVWGEKRHYYELQALRLGDEELLSDVVWAYSTGWLQAYKEEMEEYFCPEFDDENRIDDTGNFDAYV